MSAPVHCPGCEESDKEKGTLGPPSAGINILSVIITEDLFPKESKSLLVGHSCLRTKLAPRAWPSAPQGWSPAGEVGGGTSPGSGHPQALMLGQAEGLKSGRGHFPVSVPQDGFPLPIHKPGCSSGHTKAQGHCPP